MNREDDDMTSLRSPHGRVAVAISAALLGSFAVVPARAGDIIAEWATVKPPPVPVLKSVTVDPKTTALLILDLMKTNCGERPRCAATVPNVQRLLDQARATNTMVLYTLVGPPGATPGDMVSPALAAHDGEWVYQRGPDKFLGSDLEKRLKDKGIKTVIITGTSAQGVIIGTGSGSAQRGYQVIVPIDGMSSEDPYMEQYAAWHMYKGGPAIITEHVTLTRSDMIKFAN
jgi:nicotinamidase-related amidase